MPVNNHNLSFIAGEDIPRGRALRLRYNVDGDGIAKVYVITDGATDALQYIIGWSMEVHRKGELVSVRNMSEGTMECECVVDTLIWPGCLLYINDSGQVTDENLSADRKVMGYALERSTSHLTDKKFIHCLMLRQLSMGDNTVA